MFAAPSSLSGMLMFRVNTALIFTNMKKISLFISILSIAVISNAQITFQKTYGGTTVEQAFYVQQTSDSGYIFTGWTLSFGFGGYNVYLAKTDMYGNLQWTRTYGGPSNDEGYYVQQTSDGGYIIAGSTFSFGMGLSDSYLIKTDSLGNFLWSKVFGSSQYDVVYCVKQTADGGYIITGGYDAGGISDIYLIKTDSNGDSLWTKTYSGWSASATGLSVQLAANGGFVIAGGMSSPSGYDVVCLMKTDSIGNLLWTKTYGGSIIDYGMDVKNTTDGGYIITGKTYFGAGNGDVYLIKTDSTGDTLWTKTYGGPYYDCGNSVAQTKDGGYIVTGYTNTLVGGDYDIYIVKTNSNGDTLWTRTLIGAGSNNGGNCVRQTFDGGYIIAGDTRYYVPINSSDAYLIKLDSLGNSGCNLGNTITLISSPPTVMGMPSMSVSSGGIITAHATAVNSGGMTTVLCTNVGINEIVLDNSFMVLPNPSTGNFIISFEGTIMKGKVEILNILGVPINIGIAENISNESKKEINFENISDGIYFVKVFDGEKSYCKKLIVERN
jgi:type IX secretion system substrate protein